MYVGKEDNFNGSAVTVCKNLCLSVGLTTQWAQRGQMLDTNNYYSSIKLVYLMFEKWAIVGTITPTDKKLREDLDIPVLKLSSGTR